MTDAMETVKQLTDRALAGLDSLSSAFLALFSQFNEAARYYTLFARWIFPILAAVIIARCILPLLRTRKRNIAYGYLQMPTGDRLPLLHWENSIGRSKISDIVVDLPVVSRSHAVLTLRDGIWSVFDLGSQAGVQVNGKKIDKTAAVSTGDVISLAGVSLTLQPGDEEAPEPPAKGFPAWIASHGRHISSGMTLWLLLLFQLMGGLQLCFSMGMELEFEAPLVFLLFMLGECLYFLIMRLRGRRFIVLELLAFFLCGLGLFVTAAAAPGSLFKQFAAILIGVVSFSVLGLLIRDPERARKLKYILAACSLALLALNLIIGQTRFGSKNWIDLGFITVQPSEFVKIAFVLAGTATLDRLLTTRNLTAFIGYSGACVGALFLMRDLGTAVIFFAAFLMIAFMRSGDMRTLALICVGAAMGAAAVVTFMPYIASRFAAWGHVWEYASTSGYQQTRTLIACASGGLLGIGGGNGYLVNIAAADTDLVFGVLCEEWGLIIALAALMILSFFALFAVRSVGRCRSSFYAIAACGAATIFVVQTALNVFGSVDLLPLTGVTLPFVSNGGSSMVAAWSLLAFIKSADERSMPKN